MLEREDLKAIQAIMRETVDGAVTRSVDKAVKKTMDRSMRSIIRQEIEKNNTLLFDEMERYYQMNPREIQDLTEKVVEIEEYYRLKKFGKFEKIIDKCIKW